MTKSDNNSSIKILSSRSNTKSNKNNNNETSSTVKYERLHNNNCYTSLNSERGRFILNKVLNKDFEKCDDIDFNQKS